MTIDVLKPGLATSVQDLGRTGYYHLGIPPSGAMDRYSMRCANLLVGNAEDAAGLEITFLGPELAFSEAAVVAVTGARLKPRVNGQEMPQDESFAIPAGGVLSFDYIKGGARAYLAIAGGIAVPVVLASRSTYGLGALGGFQGRKLAAGDTLPVGAAGKAIVGRKLPPEFVTETPRQVELRVVVGLYAHWLTPESLAAFFDDEWTIASEADRIGYRFKGGRSLQFRPRERPFGAGSDKIFRPTSGSVYPEGRQRVLLRSRLAIAKSPPTPLRLVGDLPGRSACRLRRPRLARPTRRGCPGCPTPAPEVRRCP